MRTLVVSAAASLLTLAVGCGSPPPLSTSLSQANQPTTTKQGSGAAGAAGASTVGGSGGSAGAIPVGGSGGVGPGASAIAGEITQPDAGPSMCGRPAGDRLVPSSVADTQRIIRGTWLLCSNVGLSDQPQAGMYIGTDDRYVLLDLVGGQLVPKAGPWDTGRVEYIDTSASNGPGNIQVDFLPDGGGEIPISRPIFSDDPRLMLLDFEGIGHYTYAAVGATPGSAGTADSGPPSGTIAQPTGASMCDRPAGARLDVSSVAEMQQTIRGTWQLCSNVALGHQPQVGLFIGDDDRYVFLELVDGKLVPKTGLANKGHLEYLDINLQVNFVSDLGGYVIGNPPIFSDDPRQLSIDNEGVETYVYGRVP